MPYRVRFSVVVPVGRRSRAVGGGAKGPSRDPRYSTMSAHRVSVLRSALRRGGRLRSDDPATSGDARVHAVVEALQRVDYAPAPSAHFRAELRTQLVAVAPRIIAESAADSGTAPPTTRKGVERARAHRRRFTRPIAVTVGVAAAFLLLFGGAVWQSHKALPGDSLYGLKRASENVQLSLSTGGTDRGHEYLRLARTRVEEARALLHRDSASAAGRGPLAGGLSTQTAKLIAANLASADADLRRGSDLLNTQAVTDRSQSPIALLTGWAPGQLTRLSDLAAALPDGTLQNRTHSSWTLTSAALDRARSLAPAVANGCASTSRTDALGPVPRCSSTDANPSSATSSVPAGTASTAPSATLGPATSPPRGSKSSGPGTTSTHDTAGAPATSPIRIPATSTGSQKVHLPSLSPGAPVSVGSCGISVTLGPIGIGVGHCPSHS